MCGRKDNKHPLFYSPPPPFVNPGSTTDCNPQHRVTSIATAFGPPNFEMEITPPAWWDLCECQAEFGYVLGPCCV